MELKMKKIIILFVWVFAIGCQQSDAKLYEADELPCQVPCWYGLTPGVTTRPEFLEFINDFQQRGIFVYEELSSGSYYVYQPRKFWDGSHETYFIAFQDDVLSSITGSFGFRPLSVHHILSELGEPEKYATRHPIDELSESFSCLDWHSNDYWDSGIRTGYFLYPSRGATYHIHKSYLNSAAI